MVEITRRLRGYHEQIYQANVALPDAAIIGPKAYVDCDGRHELYLDEPTAEDWTITKWIEQGKVVMKWT
ncbi:hypothetical protein F2Q70_00000838 [Brassica cretica]|uniref:Uncharacterized protein n=1 Tax=Brassica cretica TaxID=69181 RepID=A0A8S9IN17_BRACR|nr:hypothetical protein F2Q70_00000838 [Brassica cretica]KAF3569497.1 hypothetical protein DY000_02011859 [Brassica cretica]